MSIKAAQDDWELARAIGITAAAFESVFDRAKPAPNNPADAIALGSLSDGNCSSVEKIARGIFFARANGWLHKLIEQTLFGGEATADVEALMAEAERQKIVVAGSTLQAVMDPRRGIGSAGLELYHLSRIIHQVCRIDIDGKAKGTGFLVRPDMVMTSFHVIRSLVTPDANEEMQALPDSDTCIRIVFDDLDVLRNGYSARLPGFGVAVAKDWLAGASPCHELELKGSFPKDYAELATKLDYALIRLRGVAQVGTPPVTISRKRPVIMADPVAIFQHADGGTLAIDRAKVSALYGDWRFAHDVNASHGSSGSPCFDRDFNVVGIHQAGRRDPHSNAQNRAVPLMPILPAFEALPQPDPRLMPMSELSEGRPGHPVLGRMETQDWVWRQLEAERCSRFDRPILALWASPGYGKTFTYDMLRSLLPRTLHDVVSLTAVQDIQTLAPEAFAALLLERLNYPAMQPLVFEANAERARWLADTHLPALLNALEAGRARGQNAAKGVWILIDEIDKAALGTSTEISDYLFRFYAAAQGRRWLRFVLLGYDGPLSVELRQAVARYNLDPPTDADIENYLRAKLPPSALASGDVAISGAQAIISEGIDDVPRGLRLRWLQQRVAKVAQAWAKQVGR